MSQWSYFVHCIRILRPLLPLLLSNYMYSGHLVGRATIESTIVKGTTVLGTHLWTVDGLDCYPIIEYSSTLVSAYRVIHLVATRLPRARSNYHYPASQGQHSRRSAVKTWAEKTQLRWRTWSKTAIDPCGHSDHGRGSGWAELDLPERAIRESSLPSGDNESTTPRPVSHQCQPQNRPLARSEPETRNVALLITSRGW